MKPNLPRWITCLLLAPLLLSRPALADKLPPATWPGLLEHAWRLHPQAAALAARVAEAQALQGMAGALTPEPAALSLGNLNDRQGRNQGKQAWEAEVSIPLWLPGQQAARQGEAASGVSELTARQAALRLELAGELREAWWSLAAARSAQGLAAQRLETARQLGAQVNRRFKVGELSRIDANLAEGEVLAAEAEMIERAVLVQQAEQLLRQLTGLTAVDALPEEVLASGDERLSHAAASDLHPQLAALAATVRRSRARLKVAQETSRAAPELAVRVVRERNDFADTYANNVGVRLRIPLSSGPQVRRENSAALAESEQADADMQRGEMRLQLAVDRSRQMLESSERLRVMAAARRALAADNLQLAEKSFALGEADLATLLRLRSAALDAAGTHERQRLARAAAISRFNQALGVLP